MSSASATRVPAGQEKLKLYLKRFIIDAVEVPLAADHAALKAFFTNIFADKLGNAT